jgi:MFS family permease
VLFFNLIYGFDNTYFAFVVKAYGETILSNDHFLALVGSIGTGCISVGRIFWGFVADRLPLRVSLNNKKLIQLHT